MDIQQALNVTANILIATPPDLRTLTVHLHTCMHVDAFRTRAITREDVIGPLSPVPLSTSSRGQIGLGL